MIHPQNSTLHKPSTNKQRYSKWIL